MKAVSQINIEPSSKELSENKSHPYVILFVEGNTDGTVGGSQLYMYELLTHLNRKEFHPIACMHQEDLVTQKFRKIGMETYVFSKPRKFDFRKLVGDATKLQRTIIALLLPIQRGINFIRFLILSVRRGFWLYRRKVDLIDCNNSITSNHEWMLASLMVRVKCITHESGLNTKFSFRSRFLLKHLDGIICCSEAIYNNMILRDMKHPFMPVIHSCIISPNRIKIRMSPEEIRQRFQLEDNHPIIGVVGNIKEWKGQETVIRATAILTKRFPSITCLLVGGVGDDSYFNRLMELCKELGISRHVIFTGFQSNPVDFFNIMNVVIHSSIEPEPLGMVNFEAMALKKPVIATNFGGPVEIFENGVSGILVKPGDPEELAEAVTRLLAYPERAKEIGEAGYRRLQEKFCFEDCIEKTQSVYRRILGEKSGIVQHGRPNENISRRRR